MSMADLGNDLKIYSTCPSSRLSQPGAYLRQVQDIARWSEDAGCMGILVYTDNGKADPWLVAQTIINATSRLCPLVAVQPLYMHPYSVAKMITTLGYLHHRKVHLNMVAGGFTNDLAALADATPHDERYTRLVEYTRLVQQFLGSPGAVSAAGTYYQVSNLKLLPSLHADLMPTVLVSGSSPAGRGAAEALRATAIEYPKPAHECLADDSKGDQVSKGSKGIRIGIVARPEEDEAWSVARERFPEDRKGQLTQKLAMKVSDSSWHHQLSDLAQTAVSGEHPYWLVPFQNYRTFCPYLVGSYQRVADEVQRYIGAGYRTFILDVPASPEEMRHIGRVFERASHAATQSAGAELAAEGMAA